MVKSTKYGDSTNLGTSDKSILHTEFSWFNDWTQNVIYTESEEFQVCFTFYTLIQTGLLYIVILSRQLWLVSGISFFMEYLEEFSTVNITPV